MQRLILDGVQVVLPKDEGIAFDPVEDGQSFIENALIKARCLYDIVKAPVLADDSGLVVDALDGRPGIHTARYGCSEGHVLTSQEQYTLLLKEMEGVEDRSARFVSACVLMLSGDRIYIVQETVEGSIALSPTTGVWAARDLATESLNLNLPSMGAVAGTELSPSEEQALGEEMMRQIRGDPTYLNDSETLEYLNRLGYKLVSVSDTHTYNFFFYPLIDHSLNAFAIPGGFIAVHTGLIVAAQNESELAGVIAHEIGHVSQRHIARMIDAQKGNAALTLGSFLLALLAARAGSGDAASALAIGGQAALIQNQLSYSRGAEREADRVGLNSLVKAGFDPKGMENFFMRLQKNNRYYEAAAPAYLLTHPLTVERISDMENRTRQLGSREHTDSLDFLLIQQRMRVLQETKYDGWLAVSKEMKQELGKEKDKRSNNKKYWFSNTFHGTGLLCSVVDAGLRIFTRRIPNHTHVVYYTTVLSKSQQSLHAQFGIFT